MAYDIRNVKNVTDLITYFAENLDWNIDMDDFENIEDITYDFSARDIGLQEDAFAKISSLKQLRPLVDGQPWGIFCVEFDSNRFEVTALRKILSGLVPKSRNSANHAVWDQHDLLFLCCWGSDNERTIGIAHFQEKESGLPQIRMISCAPAKEDFTQISVFEERLSKLHWPENEEDIESWKNEWSSAFTTGYHQVIRDASTLTAQLAVEAQGIRNRILDILDIETANGYVHLLYDKFKNLLIHDMTESQFADMYAQTVVYGLFSARCMDQTQEDFSADEAIKCIPNTNPFLRSLMEECFGMANNNVSFDELEIENVVDLLRNTNTTDIIEDFNRQTGDGREDPVIHFYEEFLASYDKEQKVQRGVYYTPQPVVNFIVRSVDSILKTEFDIPDGMASEETKKIKVKRESKRKIEGFKKEIEVVEEVPAIQILDPATGTGTFIRQTILQIYENFLEKHSDENVADTQTLWNQYVSEHLLPRLNAFELMMAPYAVAHMKLALVLKDTGYNFLSENRLQVYLTNTLEEPGSDDYQYTLFSDPLALESVEANKTKKNNGINIVLGNPPYSSSSLNKEDWIINLIAQYKEGLNERRIHLNDDYIKFIRYGQYVIEKSESGILAYISNNSFLDGITHRKMRQDLMNCFSEIYIINLHGNSKKKEVTPDGKKDENVFDIQQGVCISIFVKHTNSYQIPARILYYDLYGLRREKYDFLFKTDLLKINFTEIYPESPNFFFIPKDFSLFDEYQTGFGISEFFLIYNSGIQTKRDKLTISFDEKRVNQVLEDLHSLDEEKIRDKYNLQKDGRDWSVASAKEDVSIHQPQIMKILYRPFDYRYTAYTGHSRGFMGYPRDSVFKHFKGHKNIGLLVRKNTPPVEFTHVFVCNTLISEGVLGIDPNGREYVFPLYLYDDECCEEIIYPNMNQEILRKIYGSLNVDFLQPEDIFGYIYAILHSKTYRIKYSEFLKIDFPRIPYPTNDQKFQQLATLGKELMDLHLFNYDIKNVDIVFEGKGDNVIRRILYSNECVYINNNQYFTPINEENWNQFIGGYAPLQKWLNLRKGKILDDDEIICYCNAAYSMRETNTIVEEIERIIEK